MRTPRARAQYHLDVTYWGAKSDRDFMERFRADVEAMWAKEDEYANWRPPTFCYLGPERRC